VADLHAVVEAVRHVGLFWDAHPHHAAWWQLIALIAITAVQYALSAIFRKKPEDQLQEGPRLGDQVQTESVYGKFVKVCFGQPGRETGNIPWVSPIDEIVTETSETISGGGSLLGNLFGFLSNDQTITTKTYSYEQWVRVNFGETEFPRLEDAPSGTSLLEGRRARLLKLWMNKELVFDSTAEGDAFLAEGLEFVWFDGAEDQQPWDVELADTDARYGDGSTPSYRGRCGIGVKIKREEWGGQIPNVEARISYVGSAPKLPTTIYFTDVAAFTMWAVGVDWIRRLVFPYGNPSGTGGTDLVRQVDLIGNALVRGTCEIDQLAVLTVEHIYVDDRGLIFTGGAEYDGYQTMVIFDPLTCTEWHSITQETSLTGTPVSHGTSRVFIPANIPFVGPTGRLGCAVWGTGASKLIRVYATDIRILDGFIPIWDERGHPMTPVHHAYDAYGGFWRSNPRKFDGILTTAEWWISTRAGGGTILCRVIATAVKDIINEYRWDLIQHNIFTDQYGAELAPDIDPTAFHCEVEDIPTADWIPDWDSNHGIVAYVAEDDTVIAILPSGDVIKVDLPDPRTAGFSTAFDGGSAAAELGVTATFQGTEPVFEEIARIPAADFTAAGMTDVPNEFRSEASFTSYRGSGWLAIVANDTHSLCLFDPVEFKIVTRPVVGGPAVYTYTELGLSGSGVNLNQLVYDQRSHSIVFLYGNTDYRRIFLDRSDGLYADLADITQAIETRGSNADVPGPGLQTAEVDVTPLVGEVVRGFLLSNGGSAARALEPLAGFFPEESGFGITESDFQIKNIPYGVTPLRTLDETRLGAGAETAKDDPISERMTASREFPRRVSITYLDEDLEGEPGVQNDQRFIDPLPSVWTLRDLDQSYPIMSVADEAATAATRQLAHAWNQTREVPIPALIRDVELDPLDAILVQPTPEQTPFPVLLGESTLGANFLIEMGGTTDDIAAFQLAEQLGQTGQGAPPPGIALYIPTDFAVLDIPKIGGVGVSPGVYIVPLVVDLDWRGAQIQVSVDGVSWTTVGSISTIPVWGRATNVLGAFSGAGFDDTNTLTVLIPDDVQVAPLGTGFGEVLHTLTNPGAESGALTGWTERLDTGYSHWAAVTTATGATHTIVADSGAYFFSAHVDNVANAELYQDVDLVSDGVSTSDLDVDDGSGLSACDFYLEWNQTSFQGSAQDNLGGVRLDFYDDDPTTTGVLIGSQLSSQTAPAGNDWSPRYIRAAMPTGTRFVRVALVGSRPSGSFVDVYFDEIGNVATQERSPLFHFASDFELQDGANLFVIGKEVAAYGDWTYLGSNVYELSHLLRGLDCTEPKNSTHSAGDLFVLADGLSRVALSSAYLGKPVLIRAITFGGYVGALSVQSFTYLGRDILPCAATEVTAYRNPWHGDVIVRWKPGDGITGATYKVDLLSPGGSIAKTYTAGFTPIVMEPGQSGILEKTVTTVTMVNGATRNGNFETGAIGTYWIDVYAYGNVGVVTTAAGRSTPAEGTYFLRMNGSTTPKQAAVRQTLDLLTLGATTVSLDNGYAAIQVLWKQAGFDASQDYGWVEIGWYDANPASGGLLLRLDKSPEVIPTAGAWDSREFWSRSPQSARYATVTLWGRESTPVGQSVNAYWDDVQIRVKQAEIWETTVAGVWSGDATGGFTKFVEGLLVWQDDVDGPDEGEFELVKIASSRIIQSYIPATFPAINDNVGSETDSWIQYGEQIRLPLADIVAAGYQRDDPIRVRIAPVSTALGATGPVFSGTL
jgi:Putative phage tail protein